MGVLCQLVCVLRVLLNTQKGRALKGLWGKLTVQPQLGFEAHGRHLSDSAAVPHVMAATSCAHPRHGLLLPSSHQERNMDSTKLGVQSGKSHQNPIHLKCRISCCVTVPLLSVAPPHPHSGLCVFLESIALV